MGVRLDPRQLAAFDRMAVDGAASATDRLSGLTGLEAVSEFARLGVVSATAVRETSDRDDVVAVDVPFAGIVEGDAVTVFDRESARELAGAFMPNPQPTAGYTDTHDDAVAEICNVIVSGYLDGWAERRSAPVEISPPVVASSANEREPAVSALADGSDCVLSQRSSIAIRGEDVRFRVFLFVESPSRMTPTATDPDDAAIDTEPLAGLREALAVGTDRMISRARARAACAVEPGSSTLDVVPIERLSDGISDDEHVGVITELVDAPRGYVLALVDSGSARQIATAFDPNPVPSPAALEPTATDVDEPVGTVTATLAGSLVRGLEDRLAGSIETSSPHFVEDMASSILNDVGSDVGPDERFVLAFETGIDVGEVECVVYALLRPTDVPPRWCER